MNIVSQYHNFKRIALLVALLAPATHTFAQRTAHASPIIQTFVNDATEVIETQDTGTAKFWGVADGSLLHSLPMKSPEYAIKHLRLIKPRKTPRSYTAEGEEIKYTYTYATADTINTTTIFKNDVRIMSVDFPKGSYQGGIALCASKNKFLFYFLKGGFARYYIVNALDPNDANGHWKGTLLATLPIEQHQSPEFSDLGDWIIEKCDGYIINTATGAFSRVPPEARAPLTNMTYRTVNISYVLSADESRIVYGTKSGIVHVETATGKLLGTYAVPAHILQPEWTYMVHPCHDGKTFVYATNYGNVQGTKINPRRAWLVKEGKAIELVD